jgi:hypothetical protein
VRVSKFIEDRTGWSIKKFVRTARRHAPFKTAPATTY